MLLYRCHFYELVRRVLINLMTTEYEYPYQNKYEYKSHTCLGIKNKFFKIYKYFSDAFKMGA